MYLKFLHKLVGNHLIYVYYDEFISMITMSSMLRAGIAHWCMQIHYNAANKFCEKI
jgi:hypothetical protein